MKNSIKNTNKIEFLIYGIVWLFILLMPFISNNNTDQINWNHFYHQWISLFFLSIIYFSNNYFLVPRHLFQKKYINYFLLALAFVLVIVGIETYIQTIIHDILRRPPPLDLMGNRNLPPPVKPLPVEFFEEFIIGILIVAASTAVKVIFKWLSEEKLRKDLEKEQLKTNLALLRHQISPHFFMNTLNNIHALVDIDTEDAKDAIVRLSTLMRYLLYDSSNSHIKLKKEIDFIQSFVSLMQIRYSDKVDIRINIPNEIPNIEVPPMLFISFLENAFKHGVSYQANSYIYFTLTIEQKQLNCIIKNSKHSIFEVQTDGYSGIGLDNIKKSLQLLYNEKYNLQIKDTKTEFEVNLTIPL